MSLRRDSPLQRLSLAALLVTGASLLMPGARALQPTVIKAFPTNAPLLVSTNPNEGRTWNVSTNFSVSPAPTNTALVLVNSSLGNFFIQLFPTNAPETVANFLDYVNTGAYQNMIIHRSVPGFIIQTGGYDDTLSSIPTFPAIPSEYGLHNTEGTVAMALVGTDSNSGTDQWFINLTNNTSILDATNTAGNPPFTVFGQVIGNGMSVVDAIAALTTYSLGSTTPFTDLPLIGVTNGQTSVHLNNYIIITNVLTLPYFAVSSDPTAFATKLDGTNLTVSFVAYPTNPATLTNLCKITVYATETNGLTTNSSFSVVPSVAGSQTITFPQIPTQPYTTNAFNFTNYPTSSSGIPVSVSLSSGPAKVTNGGLYFTGTGTVSLTAVTETNANYQYNYKAVKPVTNSFVVAPASQTITSPSLTNEVYGGSTVKLPATDSAGFSITYSIVSGPASINGDTLTITGAGTIIYKASAASNADYLAVTVTNSFVASQASQTITFPTITNRPFSTNPFTITLPTASSKLPVSINIAPTNLATLASNAITMKGVGTVTLTANQSGNSNYLAATRVTNSFIIGLGSNSISFTQPAIQTYSTNGTFALTATAPGGKVTYTSNNTNVISVSGSTAIIQGAGTAVISASQPGSTLYASAPIVTRTVTVNKAAQSISAFATIPTQTYKAGAQLNITFPTSSSHLPVTVTIKSGPATISGATVTLTGKGTVVLIANLAATTNYNAATPVTTSFLVH